MTRASVRRVAVVVGWLLLGGGTARADFMNWSYKWSISPRPVFAAGTGTVAMALDRGGPGAPRILAAAVTTSSSAWGTRPDRFNTGFTLTLHLTDRPSHRSGNLKFQGRITGTLTFSGAHLSETFRTPTEHITLGGHTYWVRLPNRLTLLPPGAPWVPELFATVHVRNVPRPPRPHHHATTASAMLVSIASIQPAAVTPEPPALLLSAVGGVLLSLACIARYSRSAAALLRT
jgi:hypothetical protein